MTPLQLKRRKQIIDAAIVVFKKSGFHKGTIDDIATEAGLGKGTIYEYYSSKQEIFEHMIITVMKTYLNSAKKSIEGITDFKERLLTLLQFDSDFIDNHKNIIERSIYSLESSSHEFKSKINKLHEELYEFTFNIVNEAKLNGDISSDSDINLITLIIINIIGRINKDRRIFKKDIKSTHNEVLDILFNGIA